MSATENDTNYRPRNFFTSHTTKQDISNFLAELKAYPQNESFEGKRNQIIYMILQGMHDNPAEWDNYCQFNIVNIGNKFLLSERVSRPRTKEEMDSVFSDCYRFLFEYYLSKKDGISRECQEVIGFPDECLDAFRDQARIQLKYAQGKMMPTIMKGLLSSDAILTLQNVGKFKFDTEEKISGWEKLFFQKAKRRLRACKQGLTNKRQPSTSLDYTMVLISWHGINKVNSNTVAGG